MHRLLRKGFLVDMASHLVFLLLDFFVKTEHGLSSESQEVLEQWEQFFAIRL